LFSFDQNIHSQKPLISLSTSFCCVSDISVYESNSML
jgi:hypothetical protein